MCIGSLGPELAIHTDGNSIMEFSSVCLRFVYFSGPDFQLSNLFLVGAGQVPSVPDMQIFSNISRHFDVIFRTWKFCGYRFHRFHNRTSVFFQLPFSYRLDPIGS